MLFCLVFIAFGLTISASESLAQKRANSSFYADLDSAENEIFQLINRQRSRSRLEILNWDDDLADLARDYSQEMADENFFSHRDRRGRDVADRAERSGIRRWTKIGENLFFCDGFRNFSNLAVSGWLKSASHRKNMLAPDWTKTGIGVAQDRNGRIYITQIFIR